MRDSKVFIHENELGKSDNPCVVNKRERGAWKSSFVVMIIGANGKQRVTFEH